AVAIAGVALAAWARHPVPNSPPAVIRFTLPASPTARNNVLGLNLLNVSPDGRTLLYAGQGSGRHEQLVVRPLDDITSRPLPGTEDAGQPTFSPDGRWVLFIRGNQLYKVSLDGGDPQVLGNAPRTFGGGDWVDDRRVLPFRKPSPQPDARARGQSREFGGHGRPQ